MATTARPTADELDNPGTPGSGTPEEAAARPGTMPFLAWGVAAYLAVTGVVVLAVLVRLGGHLGYVLDDAAIHLSVADHLASSGTWGVTEGSFQSASSSPLWTLLLAAGLAVAPAARDLLPLLFNVVAGVAVVAVLARSQARVGTATGAGDSNGDHDAAGALLSPSHRRPAHLAAVVVLVVPVLFLPGLAVVGMEHTLHIALVLAAVASLHRIATGAGTRLDHRLAYLLVTLATLARFETAFVALGLAIGLLATDRRAQLWRAAGVLAASGLAVAAYGAFNRTMGGGWLPNSVLAKGQGTGRASPGDGDGLGPVDIVNRLTADPALAVLFVVAVAYLVVNRGRHPRALAPAWVLVVATVGHAALADIGWYERYQAYLIALGAYFGLCLLAEVPRAVTHRVLVAACLLGLMLSATKVDLLVDAPRAADDMYRHHYQAGRFLDRYYDGVPVATDQLGYISLLHDGPITDFAGLGDYEVLQLSAGRPDTPRFWAELAEERRFPVAVLYDSTAAFQVPDTWVRAGQLALADEPVTALTRRLTFFATGPDEAEPLLEHLREFAGDLPPGVAMELNEFAGLQAAVIEEAATAGDGRIP